jgi:hypothetical protein
MNDGIEFLLTVALVTYLRDRLGDAWTAFILIIATLLSPVGIGFLTGLGVLQ